VRCIPVTMTVFTSGQVSDLALSLGRFACRWLLGDPERGVGELGLQVIRESGHEPGNKAAGLPEQIVGSRVPRPLRIENE